MIRFEQKLLAEFIGTFALIFCGTGAIVVNEVTGGVITHMGVSMTFGLIVASMIFAFGDVSGAHMNPVVSLAFTLSGRFPLKELFPYIVVQTAGAVVASGLIRFLFPESEMLGSTIPVGSPFRSFALEIVLTFILVMVIFNVSSGAREKGITAAIAIGGTVGLEALFAGPVSGASMNPVRSFGPALISGHFNELWIYLTAPFAGALMGVGLHRVLFNGKS
jgi:aquaporin NIP